MVWSEIDLRWGITGDEQLDGRVLEICMRRIDECRPYFLGLIGDRYGSQVEVPTRLAQQYAWLDPDTDQSITELEFRHGALNAPHLASRAAFFVRRPAEGRDAGDEASVERLRSLTEEVRHSGLPCREFTTSQELVELVVAWLEAAIEEDFPTSDASDPASEDIRRQRDFCRARARGLVGRHETMAELTRWRQETGDPLVVTGVSGVGKSALLAAWLERHVAIASEAPRLARYFVGATEGGSTWRQLVESLVTQLGFSTPTPASPEQLRVALVEALERHSEGAVLIVLDGLDKLDPSEGAQALVWLPRVLPPSVRLVVSCTEGLVLEECKRRGFRVLTVGLLQDDERQALVASYLEGYGKRLDDALVARLLGNELSRNPLWLTAVLEELVVTAEHDGLGSRVQACADTRSIEALFDVIVSRWESDYGRANPVLVRDALLALHGARRGMTESELGRFLGVDTGTTSAEWSFFRAASRAFIVERAGYSSLYHDYLSRTVTRRYLPDDERRRALHHRLARFFAANTSHARRRDELPWQLARAEAWDELHGVLGDLEFLEASWEGSFSDVLDYWRQVEAAGAHSRLTAYPEVVANPQHDLDRTSIVADLFEQAGFYRDSLQIFDRLSTLLDPHDDQLQLAQVDLRRARLERTLGDEDACVRLLTGAEAILRELGDQERLLVCVGELGRAAIERGDLERALEYCDEALRLSDALGVVHSNAALHMAIAEVHQRRGRLEEARAEIEQAEVFARQMGDLDALQFVLGRRASLAEMMHDYEAMQHHAAQRIQLSEQIGNPEATASSMVLEAVALAHQSRLEEAEQRYRDAAATFDTIGVRSRAADARVSLATLLLRRGMQVASIDEPMAQQARRIYEAQLEEYRALGNDHGSAVCLSSLAALEDKWGDPEHAQQLLREATALFGRAGHPTSVARTQLDLAELLLGHQRTDEALQTLEAPLAHFFEGNPLPWALSRALRLLATAHMQRNDLQSAMDAATLAEQWARKGTEADPIAESLSLQADILEVNEQFMDAIPLRRQAVEAQSRSHFQMGLAASCGRLARTAAAAGDYQLALEAIEQQWGVQLGLGEVDDLRRELSSAVETMDEMDLEGSSLDYREGLRRLLLDQGEDTP